jgi:uncharacterized repeat protein (TIGR01451 family)
VDVQTVNSYTLSVSNLGPDDVSAASLDINVPPQMSATSITTSQGQCQGAYPTPTFHCDLGAMAAGSSAQVVVGTYAYQEGSGSLTASVTADRPDPDGSNNNAQLSTTVNPVADLQTVGGPYVTPGKAGRSTVTFTITVYNGGPSAASSVMVTDSWSGTTKKLQLASLSITQGSCVTSASSADCSVGTLDPGGTVTLTVTLTAQGSGTVTNIATATGAEKDPDSTNNSVTLTAST